MGVAICMKLLCLPHVRVHACACMCMHTCVGGTLQPPPPPSIQPLITSDTPHPPVPPPRAEKTQIRRITITLERIEIIQFCLKICDP